jgi:TetR/AcrR family acrAB operon transcriptional repressor
MRRTKEQAAHTRAAIVEAALRCFDRHGIASSTMEQIAAEAGVTKGAVYHHFAGKREILGAIRDQLTLPFLDAADTALLRSDAGGALERIERFLVAHLKTLEGDSRKRCALSVMLFKCEYVGDLHDQLASWRNNNERLIKAFEGAYRRARDAGETRPCVMPRAAAVETVMFFSGLVRLWLPPARMVATRMVAKAAVRTHVRCRAVE